MPMALFGFQLAGCSPGTEPLYTSQLSIVTLSCLLTLLTLEGESPLFPMAYTQTRRCTEAHRHI